MATYSKTVFTTDSKANQSNKKINGTEQNTLSFLHIFYRFYTRYLLVTIRLSVPLAAGELLAAFEMFELGDSSRPLPPLPPIKTESGPSTGPIMPIPPEIRPTLVKYRWDHHNNV